jgi:hypothetical protein
MPVRQVAKRRLYRSLDKENGAFQEEGYKVEIPSLSPAALLGAGLEGES